MNNFVDSKNKTENDDINIITYEQMYKGNVMLQVLEDFSKNWGAVIVISTPNKKEAIHYAIASCVCYRYWLACIRKTP